MAVGTAVCDHSLGNLRFLSPRDLSVNKSTESMVVIIDLFVYFLDHEWKKKKFGLRATDAWSNFVRNHVK